MPFATGAHRSRSPPDRVDPAAPDGDGGGCPITGGMVDAESLTGTIDHSGRLRFSAGGKAFAVDICPEGLAIGDVTVTAAS